jgi:hypothetical protein
MAATYYYQLYIGNTQPARAVLGAIWLRPLTSTVYMKIDGSYTEIAAGGGLVTFKEGYQWLDLKVQAGAPTGVVGQMWLNSATSQVFIYIDDWYVLTGG